ncbi:ABC-F family ATP-binding cassette domain-containing protein [Allohahella marinimesophila]|uniref:ATP-binding cassette domain-containing protein n=1 Tax=Allohahella marinimesophila TaxID=1054972 RepID=A0ABP7P7K8_9GAMM
MLQFQSLSVQRGGRYLIRDASLKIPDGQRVALVGRNGSGKSTLFSLLLGELTPEQGEYNLPGGTRIAHMAQETESTSRSALDYVVDGDRKLRDVQRRLEAAERIEDYDTAAKLYGDLDVLDGYTADVRAEQLLAGLGFKPEEMHRPVSAFSGGWRIRLNLAQALMCPSDLLLLDEPTNHLDIDAMVWLEAWLTRYPGTLLLISHDRDFINRTCGAVLALENAQLQLYSGDYDRYEMARAEQLAQQQSLYEKQQAKVASIHRFVARFGAKATKASQAQSKLKALQRMELIAAAHVDSPFDFEIPASDKVSTPLLVLDRASLGYGDVTVVKGVNMTILPGLRLGILGANGQGKSTLIKTLAGELPLQAGQRTTGAHLKIGYFAQQQLDYLRPDDTPLQHMQQLERETDGQAREQALRNFLGGFAFDGTQMTQKVADFSGGERARLALALIAWQRPNLLLLDEPTNHLDMEMRQALAVAVEQFAGAVVLVSHDRHLLNALAEDFVWVRDGAVRHFDGSLEEYERGLQAEIKARAAGGKAAAGVETKAIKIQQIEKSPEQQAADRAEQKAQEKQLVSLKKKAATAEQTMAETQAALAAVEDILGDSTLYSEGEAARLEAALKEQATLKSQLDEREAGYLELLELIEALDSTINSTLMR